MAHSSGGFKGKKRRKPPPSSGQGSRKGTVFASPLPARGKALAKPQAKAHAKTRKAKAALPQQPSRQPSAFRGVGQDSSGQRFETAKQQARSKRVKAFKGKTNRRLEQANINIEDITESLGDIGKKTEELKHPDVGFLRGILNTATGTKSERKFGDKGQLLPIAAAGAPARGGTLFSTSTPVRAAENIGVAFSKHPGDVTRNTLRGLRESAQGAPAAILGTIVETAEGTVEGDPLRGVKKEGAAYVKDASRRYGPLLSGSKAGEEEFQARIRREGAAGEAFDLSSLAIGAGAAVGRAAGKAGRSGALGARVQSHVNPERNPRPRLVESEGGEGKKQELSPNLFKASAQRGQDSLRRRVDTAGGKGHPLKIVRGAEGSRPKHPGRELGAEEVRPIFRSIGDRQVRKNVAREQSRARVGMHAEQLDEIVKGSSREMSRLSKNQRVAFYYVGVGVSSLSPKKALEDLRAHRASILENRTREERPNKTDEIPHLDRLIEATIKDAERPAGERRIYNDKLRETLDSARGREERLAAKDPALAQEQIALRRVAPGAESLGLERETPRSDAIAADEEAAAGAKASIPGHEGRLAKVKGEEAVFQARLSERAAIRRRQGKKIDAGPDRSASPETRRKAEDVTPHEIGKLEEHGRRVEAAERQLEKARELATHEDAHSDLHDEAAMDYASRVTEELAAQGREAPFYFPSQGKARIFQSDHAVGGARAIAGPHSYAGALFRRGRQDIDVQVLAEGLARSIKRRWNWNLVGRTYENNRIEISRARVAEALGKKGDAAEHFDLDSLTLKDWSDVMDNLDIDPGRVAFWNPRRFYAEHRDNHAGEDIDDTGTTSKGEDTSSGLRRAIDDATVSGHGIRNRTSPADFTDSGWQMISKAAHGEIDAITKPSSGFMRSFEIAKGKAARVLLGLGNIPWLTFQVASNALLTGFAIGPKALTGVGFVSEIVNAQKWWNAMDKEQQRAVSAYVGVGPFQEDVRVTRVGGSAAESNLVNAWRAFKGSAFFHHGLSIPKVTAKTGRRVPSISKLNPLDAMFRADNFQNNVFRRTVLYNKVKRDAYARMGSNAAQAMHLQDEIIGLFHPRHDVVETTKKLLEDPELLERYAGRVNDILGDYVTYTSLERRTLGRAVMFYGFLRYSLRLVFYTLPVKHPLTLSILGAMGQLQASEVKSLVGDEIAKELTAKGEKTSKERGREIVEEVGMPFGIGSMMYAKDGELKSIDLTRANPALNQLLSLKGVNQIPGVLPPFLNAALDQLYSTSSYRDRRFLVDGRTTAKKKQADYTWLERARIYAETQLKTAAPYRLAENWKFAGAPQGDDSLLFSPRPTQYVDEPILESIRKNVNQRKKERSILQTFFPLVPKSADADITNLAAITTRERDRRAEDKASEKKRKSRKRGGGGGRSTSSGGGGITLGGGSSGGGGGITLGN